MALAVVSSGYLCEVNGAARTTKQKAPSISEFNIYVPKELNERQKDLVEIGRYTASGDLGSLRETIISAMNAVL